MLDFQRLIAAYGILKKDEGPLNGKIEEKLSRRAGELKSLVRKQSRRFLR